MLTRDDLSQIRVVVQETIKPEIKALKKSMATKEDMGKLKSGMKGLETRLKGNMKTLESGLRGDMKTLETGLRGDMKTLESGLKGDLETGLKGLETRLIERIDDAQMEIIATVDKHKADKEDVKVLKERVDRLEDNAGLPPYPNQ